MLNHPVSPSDSARVATLDLPRLERMRVEIERAAAGHGLRADVLAAVISRETDGRNEIGDAGHGHGPGQIDDRSYPTWCRWWRENGEPEDAAIDKAAEVLAAKIAWLRAKRPDLAPDRVLEAGIAAYNHGEGGVLLNLRLGLPVDHGTTGGDYSLDVLARAAELERRGWSSDLTMCVAPAAGGH